MPVPRSWVRFVVALVTVLAGVALSGVAGAQIKNPGDHPDYAVELEPHFVLQWDNTYWADDGVGLGGRVSFPILKNGPIRTINNSLAIGVGLDWVHFSGCYGYRVAGLPYDYDCSGNQIHIPVVAQWNFFFTPVISVFAELGLAVRHATFDFNCNAGPVRAGYCDGSDTDVEGMFAVGPRFHVADAFAITLRLGYPYLTAGVSFFL